MQDYEIAAMRAAYEKASVDEIWEMRNRYRRHPSPAAQESADFLQQLLEQRIAEEDEQSPTRWSSQQGAKEKKAKAKPLTPEQKVAEREKEARRRTQDGTVVPFVTPEW